MAGAEVEEAERQAPVTLCEAAPVSDEHHGQAQLLEHFPELTDIAGALGNLLVCDARAYATEHGWQPLVIFHTSYDRHGCATFAWTLAMRETEDGARGAVIDLLRGLVALRDEVSIRWPWAETEKPETARIEERRRGVWAETLDAHDHLHPHRLERKADLGPERKADRGPRRPTRSRTPPAQDAVTPPLREPTPAERWGAQLRAARRAAGFTQLDVAQRFELTQNTISLLERGQRSAVRLSVVRAIALELGAPAPGDDDVNTSRGDA